MIFHLNLQPHRGHDSDGEKDAHIEGEVPFEVVGGVVARLAVGRDHEPLEGVQVGSDGLEWRLRCFSCNWTSCPAFVTLSLEFEFQNSFQYYYHSCWATSSMACPSYIGTD